MKARHAAPQARSASFLAGFAPCLAAIYASVLWCPLHLPGAALAPESVFALREVSAFDEGGDEFIRGQSGDTRAEPYAEVRAYPRFASARPIYGVVRFGVDYRVPDSGTAYYFAIDEGKGTGKGYDRLFFDLDHNLDLATDAPLKPLSAPPHSAQLNYSGIKEQVLFEFVAVPFDLGGGETRKVEAMTRLLRTTYEDKTYDQVSFVRTRLYAGTIRVGQEAFGARLGNKYVLTGSLNDPGAALVLTPSDGSRYYWWGSDSLRAMHKVAGTFYTISASPAGDKVTVRPYAGDLGTFALGAGKRSVDKLSFSGSLSGANTALALGGEETRGSVQPARNCLVPVGDYLLNNLNLEFGRLQIFLSDNYHSDGKPRDRGGRAPVYAVHIRKDKPFVLDFSNKPEVLFAAPGKGRELKPGDTLEVKAVLVDPGLDIMIRGLSDTTRKQNTTEDGRPLGYERNLSLDPKVAVKRMNGETVAEGVMPFG